jgi:hypothetical protein
MSLLKVMSWNDSHCWVIGHFNNVRVDIKELLFIYSALSMTQMIIKNTIMNRLNLGLFFNKWNIFQMIDLVDNKCSSFILLDLRNIIEQIVADILLIIDSVWTSGKICHALDKFIDFIDFLVMTELLMRLIQCSVK